MGKGLPCLCVHDQYRRYLEVEEGTRETLHAVLNSDTVILVTCCVSEVALEMSGGVLMGPDLYVKISKQLSLLWKIPTVLPSRVWNCVETTFKKYWNMYWALAV